MLLQCNSYMNWIEDEEMTDNAKASLEIVGRSYE